MEKVEHYKTWNLLSCIKDGYKFITFGDNEIEKRKFYHPKNIILLEVADTQKTQVFNKLSLGEW